MAVPSRKHYWAPFLVPHGEILRQSVRRGQHLVLHFPALWSKPPMAALVKRLQSQLPENYVVFFAGTFRWSSTVTVMEVISREEVLRIAPELLAAARRFRAEAGELMRQVSKPNELPLAEGPGPSTHGTTVPKDWDVFRHGVHCCFTHRTTGRVIEVCTSYGSEFGVLDPYFFYQYMATTEGMGVPPQIVEPYQDTQRALEQLVANGSLKSITRCAGLTGAFAPEQASESAAP